MKTKKARSLSPLDLTDCRVMFEVSRKVLEDDPMDFITDISGKITVFNEETEDSDIVVATCKAIRVEVTNAIEAKRSVTEVFDSYNSELDTIFGALFTERGFNPALEETTEPGLGNDILLITRVEVPPAYRGWNLGQVLALKTMEQFSGFCKYIALMAAPLQFGGCAPNSKEEMERLGYNLFTRNRSAAFSKVSSLWKEIGFVPVAANSEVLIASPIVIPPKSIKQLFKEAISRRKKRRVLIQDAGLSKRGKLPRKGSRNGASRSK